jgi:hypothetical protein
VDDDNVIGWGQRLGWSPTPTARNDNEVKTMPNQPVQEIRLGSIRALIWTSETDQGTKHNVVFNRVRATGRRLEDAGAFRKEDLPLISQVADLAHKWILQQTLS